MSVVSNFNDLILEVDSYKLRVADLERELYALRRLYFNNIMPADVYLQKWNEICNGIAVITSILNDKFQTKKEIEEKVMKLEGLDHKIAYKKVIEGKDLQTIADELYISQSWAKKRSAKIKRTIKRVNF